MYPACHLWVPLCERGVQADVFLPLPAEMALHRVIGGYCVYRPRHAIFYSFCQRALLRHPGAQDRENEALI